MTKKQFDQLMESLNIIESCRKTIDLHCNGELAPEDPEAFEADQNGSFPDWMPREFTDSINKIWGVTEDMKYKIKNAKRLLEKYEKEV